MWEFWLEHNKRHQVSFLTWSFNVCQSGRKTCLLSKVVKVKQDIRACGWGLDSLLNKKGLSWNYTIAYWELYPTGNYYQIIFWIATIWQQRTSHIILTFKGFVTTFATGFPKWDQFSSWGWIGFLFNSLPMEGSVCASSPPLSTCFIREAPGAVLP